MSLNRNDYSSNFELVNCDRNTGVMDSQQRPLMSFKLFSQQLKSSSTKTIRKHFRIKKKQIRFKLKVQLNLSFLCLQTHGHYWCKFIVRQSISRFNRLG